MLTVGTPIVSLPFAGINRSLQRSNLIKQLPCSASPPSTCLPEKAKNEKGLAVHHGKPLVSASSTFEVE
jgi:hypothetical protein